MKHRLWPKPAPLLVVALIVLLSAHVAFLHAAVDLRKWSWAAIGGVALLITLKAALILHLRKKKRTGRVITSGSKGTRD